MKGNKILTAAIAAALGYLLTLGALGCLYTSFGLSADWSRLRLVWGLTALFCAAVFSWKRGWVLALLTALLGTHLLAQQGDFWQQLWQLVYRITYIYNKAYGCGVFKLVDTAWDAGTAALPLLVWGVVLTAAAVGPLCRGGSTAGAVMGAILTLIPCVVVTDTVPEPGYLYCLILAVVLLLLGSYVRRENGSQGNRLFLLAALPTALLLGLLFQAVPQEGYAGHAQQLRDWVSQWFQDLPDQGGTLVQELAPALQTREPDSVDLASLGDRRESTIPVLSVTAETGGILYLRGQDYDQYDGKGWEASPYRVEPLGYEGVSLGYVVIETRREQEQLYLPYYPREGLSLIGGHYDNTRIVREYAFQRSGLPENWQVLAAAGEEAILTRPFAEAPAEDRQRYLVLPEQTRNQAQAYVAPLLEGRSLTWEKAAAIAAFVRDQAPYTKTPGRMPEDAADFALWFLEAERGGYCVHFASAATVLLRAAGIEARYVSGYMVSAKAGQPVTVTGEQAHAWAEYYEPGLDAWVVLEATPAEGLPMAEEVQTSPTVPVTTESRDPSAPETEAPNPTEPPETTLWTLGETEAPAQALPEESSARKGWLSWLLGSIGTLLTLELQRFLRRTWRLRSQRRGTPNRRALACWQEAERLAKHLRETPPAPLLALAQKAKFSQHTLTEEELSQFALYHSAARERLRRLPWYKQLLCHYLFALI